MVDYICITIIISTGQMWLFMVVVSIVTFWSYLGCKDLLASILLLFMIDHVSELFNTR